MSFGGGTFGGFGQQNNNNQSSTGFGGFGSNNATSGFGGANTGGFGQTNNTSGGGLFGNNQQQATSGFGSPGFGANTTSTSGFGANKPTFGASNTTGGGMFGSSNTGSTGFGSGGFGSTTATTSSPFGTSNTTGGGMFGNTDQNKTGFGASTTTTTGGFGSTTSGTGFGSGGFGATNTALGGATGDPPGTGNTPFQAYTEKEANNSSMTNSFQNITFQDPYKKWSPEELRLADYAQGRRHGNASGAGAFGQSSGFGGFGSNTQQQQTTGFGAAANKPATGTGLFGASNTSGTGFGQSTGGFGSTNTGGGMFGNTDANKTGGGLFGNTSNTTQTQQSGGLFGNSGTSGFGTNTNTSTGFGTNNASSGGVFGAANQNQQKPAGTGFSFGNTTASTGTSGFGNTTTNAFGSTNNASGGGLFGNNSQQQQSTGGGLFGNNQQQQPQQQPNTGGGLFGQQNQTQNQQSGSSLFGNNQQKPATGGLFGSSTTTSTTGGGLFGNSGTQQATSSFGANNAAGGGLFGNKPATGGGMFGGGNTASTTNTGGGLFGGAQQQQNTGGGLFGAANNQQQQKPGGLFGGTAQTTGASTFGQSNTQNQGSSLFGGMNNQQQNQGLGNSMFGNSQQASNAPQGLTANLNDVSAYGSPSLFAGVGGNEVANPGPLATSLNGNSKPRRGSILPMHKLTPASASRFATPQKRGFGFSYSNYGTPGGSPASSIGSTPGTLGRSLLGGGNNGSLSKSMSTNSLRRTYNAEDSILAPGAFSSSSSSRLYGSINSKKLVINRDIRSDLFSTPQKDKTGIDSNPGSRKLSKKVSFNTTDETEDGTPVRPALPAPEDTPTSQTEETPRQSKTVNNGSNGSRTPDADQIQGNELAIVHEENSTKSPDGQSVHGFDNAAGAYWMSPSYDDLQSMNRVQRQKVDGFTVGRENIGSITFKVPVDISSIDLDEICGGIVQLEPRSATVYPVSAKKPPVGKGLNVPARIRLEQSWPRGNRDRSSASDDKRFQKHVMRLKKIQDTAFESYDRETGVWVFSVEHFTTYGLDDSDDDSDLEPMDQDQPDHSQALVETRQADLEASDNSSAEDDTFQFRAPRGPPGMFDGQEGVFGEEAPPQQSFLGLSSADSAPHDVRLSLEDDIVADQGKEYDMFDEDLARSSLGQHLVAEQDDISSDGGQDLKKSTPGGILRARMRAMKDSAGPVKLEVADGDDWTEMLRKTVSPVKRDRQQLRQYNDSPTVQPAFNDADGTDGGDRRTSIWRKSAAKPDRTGALGASTRLAADKGRGFATSIDLMNSLFEKPRPAAQSHRASTSSKGFPKWPYERQDKGVSMDNTEQAFHDASRPTWGPSETLVLTVDSHGSGQSRTTPGVVALQRPHVQTDRQAVRLANFSTQSSKKYLRAQDSLTRIDTVNGVPLASLETTSIQSVFHNQDLNDPASIQEKRVWELASVLFDPIDHSTKSDTESHARKAALSQFWTEIVRQASTTSIGLAASSEEKAVACLAGHRVAEACKHLLDGKNFRLATQVPLIGSNDDAKREMREQLKAWHDSKMLSEFSEAIRTIYELLSGNVGVCEGMKSVPAEDRIESFVISSKFGLDWKQAFGLRLWYAIAGHDDLSVAVQKFQHDVDQDKEGAPRPWYADQGIQPLWDDDAQETRQHLLWGLLQLYSDKKTDLEAILRPENSQLSPLDMRLSWQLGLALVSTGKVSYGPAGNEKADATTLAYASQLTSAGEWLEAVFVLLHLSDATARTRAVQEHLCRHAAQIGPESGPNFTALTQKLQIPSRWIWEALALYMRSIKRDPSGEVECLLRAGSFVEAHRVLTHQVAPMAIVERDYATLSDLISQFDGRHGTIPEWSAGGEIYAYFLELLQHRQRGESTPPRVLERLLGGLHAMNDDTPATDLVRYAAVSDMADETAKELLKLTKKKQDAELRSKILNLPLTQDRLLAYSMDLGVERKREVMSH